MKVTMIQTAKGSPNGWLVVEYKAGQMVDLPETLARSFISQKVAEAVESKALPLSPENKALSEAPENKAVKPNEEEAPAKESVSEEETPAKAGLSAGKKTPSKGKAK